LLVEQRVQRTAAIFVFSLRTNLRDPSARYIDGKSPIKPEP
jgi:hypothetical protein